MVGQQRSTPHPLLETADDFNSGYISWHSFVVLGLPANNSSVRLEILDKERHIISSSVVGGEHRLTNYRSVTTLHSSISGTVAVESYVVDALPGHMAEDTCTFADTIGSDIEAAASIFDFLGPSLEEHDIRVLD
ncbi:hypothetical protein F8388_022645 [Cannabis sativa]|uniref:Uncharacterized protein n=1 Tax=Cannabis sativa TaxID=3483 RepID=A0A7J6G4E4_CANSA|nr:hypothetical protein F8388_022645 [Cannabis sativa]